MKSWTMITGKNKLLFATVLAGVFLATCATHDTAVPSDATVDCDSSCPLPGSAPAPKVETQTITQENWSFVLTGTGWKNRETPVEGIKVAMANDVEEMMVLFVKEDIGTDSYPEYVFGTVKAFAEGGALVHEIKQVTINDRKLVQIELTKDGEVIWAWVTATGGWGYGLTCGGVINVDAGKAQYDLCQSVAASLQIK